MEGRFRGSVDPTLSSHWAPWLTLLCVYSLPWSRNYDRDGAWVVKRRTGGLYPSVTWLYNQGDRWNLHSIAGHSSLLVPTSVTQALPHMPRGFIQVFAVHMPFTDPATNRLLHLFSFFHLGLVLCKLSELNQLMERCTWSGGRKGEQSTQSLCCWNALNQGCWTGETKKGQRSPISALLGKGKNTRLERQARLAEDLNNWTIT